jgi:hypothetical protein
MVRTLSKAFLTSSHEGDHFHLHKGVTQNMNTFKRKALMSAVLDTLGAAGTAQAIYQDPNGLGQVLIYPYYTVQTADGTNAFNTFVSVVNTTTAVKIVKVRFREGKNSAEVLDFNLYLSPNDVWTGAIVPASTDPAAPGHIVTFDLSCTNPVIPTGRQDFRNFQYTGSAADGLGTGLDRTREGYFEMLEVASPTGGLSGTGTLINIVMHARAISEYILDTRTKSNTDWGVTMPTRHWFIDGPVSFARGGYWLHGPHVQQRIEVRQMGQAGLGPPVFFS